jgi:hypothetical protein
MLEAKTKTGKPIRLHVVSFCRYLQAETFRSGHVFLGGRIEYPESIPTQEFPPMVAEQKSPFACLSVRNSYIAMYDRGHGYEYDGLPCGSSVPQRCETRADYPAGNWEFTAAWKPWPSPKATILAYRSPSRSLGAHNPITYVSPLRIGR